MNPACMNTPQANKHGSLVDCTIMNTPMPQASSTVERKPIVSKLSKVYQQDHNDDVKKYRECRRKTDAQPHVNQNNDENVSLSSLKSSVNSSLGILSGERMEALEESIDNVSQLSDEMFKKPKVPSTHKPNTDNSHVTNRLQMQRFLAEKTLERANTKKYSLTNPIGNLPSYLLKTNISNLSESGTLVTGSIANASDLDSISNFSSDISNYSLADKTNESKNKVIEDIESIFSSISKEIKETDNSNHQSKLETVSDAKVRYKNSQRNSFASLSDIISNMSLDDDFNKNNNEDSQCSEKFRDESFTSGENAMKKLLDGEISWMNERGMIVPCEKSSLLNSAVLDSSSAKLNEHSASIGEFFSRRTMKLDDLALRNSTDKPDSVPCALIEDFTQPSVSFNTCSDDEEKDSDFNDTSEMQSSILSVTKIAEALNNNLTPEKFIDILIQSKQNKCRKTFTRNSSTTTLKGDNKNIPEKLESSRNNMTTVQSIGHINSTNNDSRYSNILKECSTNIPKNFKKEQTSYKHKNRMEGLYTEDTTKQFVDSRGHSSQNNYVETSTLTDGVIDNSSRNFPELDMSAVKDLTTSSVHSNILYSDHWIEVQSDIQTVYTNVPRQATISFKSLSHRWIIVTAKFEQLCLSDRSVVPCADDIARLKIPNKQILIEPEKEYDLNFHLTVKMTSSIILVFRINLKDMITKAEKNISHELLVTSSDPEISLPAAEDMSINFDLVGEECNRELVFPIVNHCSTDIPVQIIIEQENCSVPVFLMITGSDTVESFTVLKLQPNEVLPLRLTMKAPLLNDLGSQSQSVKLYGKLQLYIGSTQSSHLLHEVDIFGEVGKLKLQFRDVHIPVILKSGETKSITVDNTGIVSLSLDMYLIDENQERCHDNIFVVEPAKLLLSPGQSGFVTVTFNMNSSARDNTNRIMVLQNYQGPAFKCPLQGVCNKYMLPSKNSSIETLMPRRSSASPKNYNLQKFLSPPLTSERDCYYGSISPKSSTRSSSSCGKSDNGSLQDGKLPITSTKTQLVWGCVKPGKTSCLEFSLRNRSNQRIKLQAQINNSNFKFQKDTLENIGTMNMALLGNESRTFTVIFAPSKVGAAIGRLGFSLYNSSVKSKKVIGLFGYGGHINLDFENVARDVSDNMWLSVGHLDSSNCLRQSFNIHNKGTLPAFALVKVNFKDLNPFMESNIIVSPNRLIIKPGEKCPINIEFNPKHSDILKLVQKKEVIQIASLNVITGSETTRYRIKRHRMKQSNHAFNDAFHILCESFPNENIPKDLAYFREDLSALRDLFQEISSREINITVERNPETTTFEIAADVDETSMFHTMCSEQTTMLNITESSIVRRHSTGACFVKPMSLVLTPVKLSEILYICSTHSRPMPYEVVIKPSGFLTVTPTEGVIAVHGTTTLNVTCPKVQQSIHQNFKILVYVENDVMSIDVRLIFAQPRRMRH